MSPGASRRRAALRQADPARRGAVDHEAAPASALSGILITVDTEHMIKLELKAKLPLAYIMIWTKKVHYFSRLS